MPEFYQFEYLIDKEDGACSINSTSTSTSSTSNFKLNTGRENGRNADLLYIFLKSQMPTRTEEEVRKALQAYRAQNNDILSGKTIENILTNVKKILEYVSSYFTPLTHITRYK